MNNSNTIFYGLTKIKCSIVFLIVASVCQAQLRLPKYFSDYAVLQRDQPVKLWGWSNPEDNISVFFGGEKYMTRAESDSIWRVSIPAKSAGGPYEIKVSNGKDNLVIKDIYFGDVFFCSGQSNMVFTMNKEVHRRDENGNHPFIRQLDVKRATAISPQNDVPQAKWLVSNEENLDYFSAVAYYFSKNINLKEKVPVGIILSAYGGSPIETFMSPKSLEEFPVANEKVVKITPKYIKEIGNKNQTILEANPRVKNPKGYVDIQNRYPTMVYNGMIAPFFLYPIKGVLWYQGEANTVLPLCFDYEKMLGNLIGSWRDSWNNRKLPFFIVQLPSYGKTNEMPVSSGWTIVQEAQYNTAKKTDNVGLVVINDLGEEKNIHPANKVVVGNRLASIAFKTIYGYSNSIAEGPEMYNVEIKDGGVEISFKNIGSGLVSKGQGKMLCGFAIAGKDNKFYRAKAEIRDNKVWCYSKKVTNPIHVRYAFESNPECVNFFNKEGFPAVPFRTDRLEDALKRI